MEVRPCPICDGEGTNPCHHCDGSGRCDKCSGSGRVYNRNFEDEPGGGDIGCNQCQSREHAANDRYLYESGSGRCRYCDGEGALACSNCKSKGFVKVPD